MAKPRSFKDGKTLLISLEDYVEKCNSAKPKRFPNISGWARHCRVAKSTLYAQKERYSNEFAMCEDVLEDEALQHNSYIVSLYLKNKFGYTDKIENTNNDNQSDVERIVSAINKIESPKERIKAYNEFKMADDVKFAELRIKYGVG